MEKWILKVRLKSISTHSSARHEYREQVELNFFSKCAPTTHASSRRTRNVTVHLILQNSSALQCSPVDQDDDKLQPFLKSYLAFYFTTCITPLPTDPNTTITKEKKHFNLVVNIVYTPLIEEKNFDVRITMMVTQLFPVFVVCSAHLQFI